MAPAAVADPAPVPQGPPVPEVVAPVAAETTAAPQPLLTPAVTTAPSAPADDADAADDAAADDAAAVQPRALLTPATVAEPQSNGSAATETTDDAPASGQGTRALPDGSPPGPDYTIKGNAGSMLFHTPSSPYFTRTKAEVWFRSADEARAAGFTEWTRKRASR